MEEQVKSLKEWIDVAHVLEPRNYDMEFRTLLAGSLHTAAHAHVHSGPHPLLPAPDHHHHHHHHHHQSHAHPSGDASLLSSKEIDISYSRIFSYLAHVVDPHSTAQVVLTDSEKGIILTIMNDIYSDLSSVRLDLHEDAATAAWKKSLSQSSSSSHVLGVAGLAATSHSHNGHHAHIGDAHMSDATLGPSHHIIPPPPAAPSASASVPIPSSMLDASFFASTSSLVVPLPTLSTSSSPATRQQSSKVFGTNPMDIPQPLVDLRPSVIHTSAAASATMRAGKPTRPLHQSQSQQQSHQSIASTTASHMMASATTTTTTTGATGSAVSASHYPGPIVALTTPLIYPTNTNTPSSTSSSGTITTTVYSSIPAAHVGTQLTSLPNTQPQSQSSVTIQRRYLGPPTHKKARTVRKKPLQSTTPNETQAGGVGGTGQ